jgi:putative ABC transport system permease protein
VYRLLLLAFPRRIRREFGDAMVEMFVAQVRAARADGQSVARVWLLAIGDALVHGTAERLMIAREHWTAALRGAARWRWWMRAMAQDARYGARMLVRQPVITVVALLTLALGIGANVAIFSAVNAVLLRPLPYPEPDRLVMLWEKRQAEGVLDNVVSPADFRDWARMNTVFESMAAFTPMNVDLTGRGEPVRLNAAAVSPAFFDVLRIGPQLGRAFNREDGIAGRQRVAIVGAGLWRRLFGADRSVIGSTVVLNGTSYEIVGVLPDSFEFSDTTVELWAPLALDGLPQPPSRAVHQFFVYARLKPQVTLEQARGEMDRLAAQLSEQYPQTNRTHGVWVTALDEQLTGPSTGSAARSGSVRASLLLLLGAVAFVLLIACVNVANLLLVRAAGRRREMAVRSAIGAGRGRLVGQTLTESLTLSLAGGTIGLLVASWGTTGLRALVPRGVQVVGLQHMGLDGRVLAFALALSLLTGVLFGLLPAWQLARVDMNAVLREGTRTAGPVRRRLRMALIVSEIALASLLLFGAGLALRSFDRVLRVEAGFDVQGILVVPVVLPGSRYRDATALVGAFQQIEQQLTTLPGVRAVGAVSQLPLSGQDNRYGITIEGRDAPADTPTRAHVRSVTPGYFHTMGVRLEAGRPFADADTPAAPLVAIVNETMARRYWPGDSPLGKRLLLNGTSDMRVVVGIVRDVRHWGLDAPVNPELYLPLAQQPSSAMTFVVAATSDPGGLAGAVRDRVRQVDRALPVANLHPMTEVAAAAVAARRSTMMLLGVFAAIALVLAAAGIYGVMGHLVAVRTNEIGLRMTLGARPVQVLRLVLTEGAIQAAIGLTAGLTGAVFLVRFFRSLLYEVEPADPLTLATVAALLLTTALLACLVPALRAMRIEPVAALRES